MKKDYPKSKGNDELVCIICNESKPKTCFKLNDSLRGHSAICLDCAASAKRGAEKMSKNDPPQQPEDVPVQGVMCFICNKTKPKDHFKPNDSLRGCSSACLECTQEALKHPHPDIKIDGEPNVPEQDRVVRSEEFSDYIKSESSKKNVSFGILDFSGHMDIHNAVVDLAKKEFRTFDLQVLYILNQYIDRIRVMEAL